MSPATRRLLFPCFLGIVGTLTGFGLSYWQFDRLTEKEALIERIDTRLETPPVPIPEELDPKRDEFMRVTAEGRFGIREIHVLTTQKPHGPGFKVISPFKLQDGRVIMIDRGYVPERLKEPGTRALPAGVVSVTGPLFWPTDGATTKPDINRNIWFSRRVPLMARRLRAEEILIVAEPQANAPTWPEARRLGVNIPNNHLQYAITWLSLAVVWGLMSVFWIRYILRDERI